MLQKLRSTLSPHKNAHVEAYKRMLRQEATIGGKLFGRITEGGRREFLCLDERTWIWHEEWRDDRGRLRIVVTRYDVLPHGICKAQDNQPYQYIGEVEARRLYRAIEIYNEAIDTQLYG